MSNQPVLPGTKAPVRLWADPSAIEPEAAQQLRNVEVVGHLRQVVCVKG
jgi:hypothetical protein